jgi:two-component system, NarL family, invasion response regulator UvrY
MMQQTIQIAVADDHKLFRKGLIRLLESLGSHYKIIIEASDGKDFSEQLLASSVIPDIAILDINMPNKNGFETVQWLNNTYPNVKVLIISMIEREESIVRLLKMGVKGYLSKDVEPEDLEEAINSILHKGFYYTDFITGKLMHNLIYGDTKSEYVLLTEKEIELLQLLSTDLTYKEIAQSLDTTVKTIDYQRDALCKKLNVVSRLGLAIYAIKNNIITV